MQNWYVLYTKPHCEPQVERRLMADGIETYYPTIPVALPRRGRPAVKSFFPCYLFAHVDLLNVGISNLNWIPGMRNLVMFGGLPAHVDSTVIDRIRAHLAQPNAMDRNGGFLKKGDHVVINSGPLQDVEAVFDARLSAAGRVRVLVQCLKRWTTVELEANSLSKI